MFSKVSVSFKCTLHFALCNRQKAMIGQMCGGVNVCALFSFFTQLFLPLFMCANDFNTMKISSYIFIFKSIEFHLMCFPLITPPSSVTSRTSCLSAATRGQTNRAAVSLTSCELCQNRFLKTFETPAELCYLLSKANTVSVLL